MIRYVAALTFLVVSLAIQAAIARSGFGWPYVLPFTIPLGFLTYAVLMYKIPTNEEID